MDVQNAMSRAMVILASILLAGCSPCGEADTKPLLVFCSSGNKPALEEIAARFEQEKGTEVEMIFGGAGTLLSKIELARHGDIYVPGSPDYIATGERKKLLTEGIERIVAYLIPVIITPKGNPVGIRSLEDLARPGVKVGIGNPETIPIGLYAVEILERNRLLETVMRNVVTFGENGPKTANLAALGHVDATIGYRVFHLWNPSMTECVLIDPEKLPRISYVPIAIPVFARNRGLSEEFVKFVVSPYGRSVYERYGYITREEKAREFAPGASIGGEYSLPPDYFRIIKDWARRP